MTVGLKKVVDKPEVRELLNKLAKETAMPVMIKDKNGAWLVGGDRPEAKGVRDALLCAVVAEGETIGWVFGGERAQVMAAVLSHLVGMECEKTALAGEVYTGYDFCCDVRDGLKLVERTDNCLKIIRKYAGLILQSYLPEGSAYWLAIHSSANQQVNIVDNIGLTTDNEAEIKFITSVTGSLYLQNSVELIEQNPVAGSSLKSILALPLQVGGRAVGVVAFASSESGVFDHRLVSKLCAFSDLFSAVVCAGGVIR
ncbi:MAG: hypothetical protein N3A57_05120 [Negativicutes bacterium]|nr:hypothetical protein [Negativicutes bacterium]